jgi:hypothetical protein
MTMDRRGSTRLAMLLCIGVVATPALVAPMGALGKHDRDPLRVRFEAPVTFEEGTSECRGGIVRFGISALGKTGSAINCLQGFDPVDCPSTVEALFCQQAPLLMTLRLPGGEIEAELTLFEIWSCGDPGCETLAVEQQWRGTVVDAKRRFHKLTDATVTGGGIAVFDAETFVLLGLDEAIVIGGGD